MVNSREPGFLGKNIVGILLVDCTVRQPPNGLQRRHSMQLSNVVASVLIDDQIPQSMTEYCEMYPRLAEY